MTFRAKFSGLKPGPNNLLGVPVRCPVEIEAYRRRKYALWAARSVGGEDYLGVEDETLEGAKALVRRQFEQQLTEWAPYLHGKPFDQPRITHAWNDGRTVCGLAREAAALSGEPTCKRCISILARRTDTQRSTKKGKNAA